MRDVAAQVSRVWIIDDDEPFRAMVADASAMEGLQTDGFDPAELTDRLRAGDRPDGVMLDGGMGFAAYSDALSEVLRVVLCSARSYSDLPEWWIGRPNVRVLLKPFTLEQLVPALRWLALGEDGDGWETPRPERTAQAVDGGLKAP